MKLAVLFSGGKDSCLALHKVLENRDEVRYLLSVLPENFDSFMFHKPYENLLKKQAEELGIELVVEKSLGEENVELKDLENLIGRVSEEVEGIVIGGIASNYQYERIKKICDGFGLELVAPILGYSSEEVWRELLRKNFEVVFTKVACDGLGEEWLGVKIDEKKFDELKKLAEKFRFRVDLEGGEAESAVLGMPEFKNKIKIDFDVVGDEETNNRFWMENLRVK